MIIIQVFTLELLRNLSNYNQVILFSVVFFIDYVALENEAYRLERKDT